MQSQLSEQYIKTAMRPTDYEYLLAEHYRRMGYDVQTTPVSGDYGIDLFASKGSSKLGIQAKMYGKGRKVNREMIMQLHGARCYFGCTSAVLAMDGIVMEDAQEVAGKLCIELLHFIPDSTQCNHFNMSPSHIEPADISNRIDDIWECEVMPLQGSVLRGASCRENIIVKVDWTGVTRISSNDKSGHFPFEVFRFALAQFLTKGSITRQEINDHYAKRGSSGIFLILEQISLFERSTNPLQLTLKQ